MAATTGPQVLARHHPHPFRGVGSPFSSGVSRETPQLAEGALSGHPGGLPGGRVRPGKAVSSPDRQPPPRACPQAGLIDPDE